MASDEEQGTGQRGVSPSVGGFEAVSGHGLSTRDAPFDVEHGTRDQGIERGVRGFTAVL